MADETAHDEAVVAASRTGTGIFNAIAVPVQLLVVAFIVMTIAASNEVKDPGLLSRLQIAGGVAGILLAAALPLTTLMALLGLRRRCGAGRGSGEPRQLLCVDMFAFLICVLLLFGPLLLLFGLVIWY